MIESAVNLESYMRYFKEWKERLEEEDNFAQFFNYFENEWIKKTPPHLVASFGRKNTEAKFLSGTGKQEALNQTLKTQIEQKKI